MPELCMPAHQLAHLQKLVRQERDARACYEQAATNFACLPSAKNYESLMALAARYQEAVADRGHCEEAYVKPIVHPNHG
jgi:hypothetical protein